MAWLSTMDPPWYWLVIVTVRLWLQCGFYMILFLAALQNINPELYEAAYVDGAKPGWKIFRHITLPLLKPTSISVLLLCLIAAYQALRRVLQPASATWSTPGHRWSTSTTSPSAPSRTSGWAARAP